MPSTCTTLSTRHMPRQRHERCYLPQCRRVVEHVHSDGVVLVARVSLVLRHCVATCIDDMCVGQAALHVLSLLAQLWRQSVRLLAGEMHSAMYQSAHSIMSMQDERMCSLYFSSISMRKMLRSTCLVRKSSSSPPQPQNKLLKPLHLMNCSGVSAVTPPKYVA